LPSTLTLKIIGKLSKNLMRKSMWACGSSCVRYGIATAHFTILWLRTWRRSRSLAHLTLMHFT